MKGKDLLQISPALHAKLEADRLRYDKEEKGMNDRELLEMAARAAGIRFMGGNAADGLNVLSKSGIGSIEWNPLTSDGDAFRLAVCLNMCVTSFGGYKDTMIGFRHKDGRDAQNIIESHGEDPYAATRRAIVRAAAAIGEGME